MNILWMKSNYDVPDDHNEKGILAIHANPNFRKNSTDMVDELSRSDRWCAIYCASNGNEWADLWKHGRIIALVRPSSFLTGESSDDHQERGLRGGLQWTIGARVEPENLRVIACGDAPNLAQIVDDIHGLGKWKAKHQAVTRGNPKRLDDLIWQPVAHELEKRLASYLK